MSGRPDSKSTPKITSFFPMNQNKRPVDEIESDGKDFWHSKESSSKRRTQPKNWQDQLNSIKNKSKLLADNVLPAPPTQSRPQLSTRLGQLIQPVYDVDSGTTEYSVKPIQRYDNQLAQNSKNTTSLQKYQPYFGNESNDWDELSVQHNSRSSYRAVEKSSYDQSLQSTTLGELATTDLVRKESNSQTRVLPASMTQQRKTKTSSNDIELSSEQLAILNLIVKKKESVFYTGNAGTGKSILLKSIINELKTIYRGGDDIGITAPTGIAACNIGGVTLHSWAGCGLAKDPVPKLVAMVRNNMKTSIRWRNTKVLIIDEISMVDGPFLDKLEEMARFIRGSSAPFGGIQLVICGDFLQLPPVAKSPIFAFEANCWSKCIAHTMKLTQIFRQKDPRIVGVLNDLRVGSVNAESLHILSSLSRELPKRGELLPTQLFSLRGEVDKANAERLAVLPGNEEVYHADDSGDTNKLKETLAQEVLTLKKNAQVMLIKNLQSGLVNGSRGIVIRFDEKTRNPIVAFEDAEDNVHYLVERETWTVEMNGKIIAQRTQIPLILSYAMSIHKSQGQTLDYLKVDLNSVFETGQAYVALSRASSLEGLQVLNFRPAKVKVHPKVIQFERQLKSIQK